MELLKASFAQSVFYEEHHFLKNIILWTLEALLVE
jgi:hypothetical protein